IKRGEVQGMSAGTGITHSEFNASKEKEAHLLQIWIMPHTASVTPSYGEWLPKGDEAKGWSLAASESGEGGSICIHQDAKMYITVAKAGESRNIPIAKGRYGWLQVGKGGIEANGKTYNAGDGIAFSGGDMETIRLTSDSELLLFDLA